MVDVVSKSRGEFRGQIVQGSTSQPRIYLGTLSRYMNVGSMPKRLGSGICIPVLKGKGQRSGCYLSGQMTDINTACIRLMRTTVRLRIASHPFIDMPPGPHAQEEYSRMLCRYGLL